MINKPLISYVITTYNIENYIEESILCAFSQTYSPLEIIVSDDYSTDHTFDIIQKVAGEYKGNHKIILNRNKTNLGITRHMNKAYIELATGDIIIAAHGDDISLPQRTELSYDFLQRHPDCTAVSCSMKSIDENGQENDTDNAMVKTIQFYDLKNPEKGGIPNIPAPSRAFYRKIMTSFGPLQDFCPTEDELISFRSLLLGRNAFLPDVMVKYRKHQGSCSNACNFSRFPLGMILKQQLTDMYFAIEKGWVDQAFMERIIPVLQRNKVKRELYRRYFADRSVWNLVLLLLSTQYTLRTKLYFIKKHIIK